MSKIYDLRGFEALTHYVKSKQFFVIPNGAQIKKAKAIFGSVKYNEARLNSILRFAKKQAKTYQLPAKSNQEAKRRYSHYLSLQRATENALKKLKTGIKTKIITNLIRPKTKAETEAEVRGKEWASGWRQEAVIVYLGKKIIRKRYKRQIAFDYNSETMDTLAKAKLKVFDDRARKDTYDLPLTEKGERYINRLKRAPKDLAAYKIWLAKEKKGRLKATAKPKKATTKKTTCKGRGCASPSKAAKTATKKIIKVAKMIQAQGGKKEVISKKKVNKIAWSEAVSKSAKMYRFSKKK